MVSVGQIKKKKKKKKKKNIPEHSRTFRKKQKKKKKKKQKPAKEFSILRFKFTTSFTTLTRQPYTFSIPPHLPLCSKGGEDATALLLRFTSLSHKPRHTLSHNPRHTLTCIHIHNSYTLTDSFASPLPCTILLLSPSCLFYSSFAFVSQTILCNIRAPFIFPLFHLCSSLDQQSHSFDPCRLLCTLIKFTYIAFRRSNRYHPSRIIIKSQLSYKGSPRSMMVSVTASLKRL